MINPAFLIKSMSVLRGAQPQHSWWRGALLSANSPPLSWENNPCLPLSPCSLVKLTPFPWWPDDLMTQDQPINTPALGSGWAGNPLTNQGLPVTFSGAPGKETCFCWD